MPTEYLCVFSGSVPVQLQTPMLIIGKCVALILKLSEISKSPCLTQNTSPELILSSSAYTQSVRDTGVRFRLHYPKILQSLSQTIWEKILTSFFNLSCNQFLAHLLTTPHWSLSPLLFIPLTRSRLISIISPSSALLMHSLSRGTTVTLWWQWQKSSVRGHWCSGLQGSWGCSDLHKSSIFHL